MKNSSSSSFRDGRSGTAQLHSSPCAALIKAALKQLHTTGVPLGKEGPLDAEVLQKRTLKPIQQPHGPGFESSSTESESRRGPCLALSTPTPHVAFSQRPASCAAPLGDKDVPPSVSPCAMLIKAALAQFHQEGTSVEQDNTVTTLKQRVLKPVPKPAEPESVLLMAPRAPFLKTTPSATRPALPPGSSPTTPLTATASASDTKRAPGPAPPCKLTFTAADLAAEVEARKQRRASAATVDSRTTASSTVGSPDDDACDGVKPHPSYPFHSEPLENTVIPVVMTEAENAVKVSSTGIPVVAPWPIKNGSSPFLSEPKTKIRSTDASCEDVVSATSAQAAQLKGSGPPADSASPAPAKASTAAESSPAEAWFSDVSETEDGSCGACMSPSNRAGKAPPPSKAASLYRIVTDPQEVAKLWKTLTCRYIPE